MNNNIIKTFSQILARRKNDPIIIYSIIYLFFYLFYSIHKTLKKKKADYTY